jgi:DNA-binding GntR family transcriptional regulator
MAKKRKKTPHPRLRYREIADTLLKEISEGKHPVGDMLPTEVAMCSRFNVSRYTVRESLRLLEQMGVVSRRQGSGTRVEAREPSAGYTQSLSALGELLQYPVDTVLKLENSTEIVAGKQLAETLRCPLRKRWQMVSGVRRAADNTPICWSDIYVLPRFAGLAKLIGTERKPVYTLLEKHFDTRALRVEVELFADTVSAAHADQLEVAPESPALIIIRRYFDADDICFEVSVSRHPGDRFTYSMNMEREWGAGGFEP